MFTTFEQVSFEPGTDRLDFCVATEAGINDVYLTDLDGTLNFPFAVTQDQATIVSNHRNMLEFIDSAACEVYEDRCYQYCPGTCFRTARFEIDPAETSNFFLRVCRLDKSDSCIFVQGRLHNDAPKDSARHLRVFVAHLPKGNFMATFVNGIGTSKWPSFVDFSYEDKHCEEGFSIGDVSLEIPFSTDQCKHLIRNGKFEISDDRPSYWLQRDGGELQIVPSIVDGSNALSSVKPSSALVITQFLDNRCLSAGTWFHVGANIQVVEGDSSPIVCDGSKRRCPQIGLHTESGGFRVLATTTSDDIDAYVQIDTTIAQASAVSLYIASRQHRPIIVDNVFMRRIDDPNVFCKNLIRNSVWQGLWKGTPKLNAATDHSPTALRYSNRAKRNEGPRYVGFRNIDLQCLTAGSVWRIMANIGLVDRATGAAASCDTTKAHLCPSIRLVLWDGSGNRILQRSLTEYVNSKWDANGFNRFRTDFRFPSDWDGTVRSFLFDIVGFPSHLDLVFDQVVMMRL